MVTSKFMGLSPIFLSIMVASRKDPNRKNSSTFPVAVCKTDNKRHKQIYKYFPYYSSIEKKNLMHGHFLNKTCQPSESCDLCCENHENSMTKGHRNLPMLH